MVVIGNMRIALVLALVVCATAGVFAQASNPSPEPPTASADSVPPIITFQQVWDQALPPYFSVGVDGAGKATYHSSPQANNTGDPYDLKFNLSEEAKTKIFDLAKQLKFFQGDFDYKKSRIAFTGTKTLRFKNGKEEHQTSYNWSDNLSMQEITKIFQNISETIELGRSISDKYRFDKLGVDAEMKKLEQAAKDDRTAELQAISPILTKIAKDPGMMNITRRRAESLLAKIPKSAKISGQ
jgi:hypothetical protein